MAVPLITDIDLSRGDRSKRWKTVRTRKILQSWCNGSRFFIIHGTDGWKRTLLVFVIRLLVMFVVLGPHILDGQNNLLVDQIIAYAYSRTFPIGRTNPTWAAAWIRIWPQKSHFGYKDPISATKTRYRPQGRRRWSHKAHTNPHVLNADETRIYSSMVPDPQDVIRIDCDDTECLRNAYKLAWRIAILRSNS